MRDGLRLPRAMVALTHALEGAVVHQMRASHAEGKRKNVTFSWPGCKVKKMQDKGDAQPSSSPSREPVAA